MPEKSGGISAVLLHKGYQSQTLCVLIDRIRANAAANARKSEAQSGRVLTVLDRTNPDATDRVAQLVRRILDKRSITRTVGPDDDLRGCGLSSLDIVNLMLAVETEFALRIPEREMTPANFRSIARIAALVAATPR
jgi:acyl carrier protein